MNKNLWLLALCQGLFLTNNVVFIAINGLVGLQLAPYGWMATLPVMGYVVGGALATGWWRARSSALGAQVSFQIGLAVALGSALLGLGGVRPAGCCGGHGDGRLLQRQRAVVPLCRGRAGGARWREKAVSLVLAGGLLGAVAGPQPGQRAPLLPCLLPAPTWRWRWWRCWPCCAWRHPLCAAAAHRRQPAGRPLGQIMRQPAFMVATLGAALGYGVMNLLMAATPLAMQVCGFAFGDAALVLEWHVIGMFAPGFFTGHLIKRLGALPVMGAGVLLNLACVAVSGVELHQFGIALFLLGVGWNFLFTGSTTLSLRPTAPRKRTARRPPSTSLCSPPWRSPPSPRRAGDHAGLDAAELRLARAHRLDGHGRAVACHGSQNTP
jgi:hypothetical protein